MMVVAGGEAQVESSAYLSKCSDGAILALDTLRGYQSLWPCQVYSHHQFAKRQPRQSTY